MNTILRLLVTTICLFGFMRVSSAAEPPPLETVKQVELNRYLGLWYEIGSLPQWFQRDCFGTTAEYSMRDDGKIKVINTCFKGSLEGRKSVAKGKAWSVDPSNAKLKVQFFWPFRGDYWIIELGDNYEYAVVGAPNRKYLWILARTPRIDETLYNQLLETIKTKHHYDLSKFQKSVQR